MRHPRPSPRSHANEPGLQKIHGGSDRLYTNHRRFACGSCWSSPFQYAARPTGKRPTSSTPKTCPHLGWFSQKGAKCSREINIEPNINMLKRSQKLPILKKSRIGQSKLVACHSKGLPLQRPATRDMSPSFITHSKSCPAQWQSKAEVVRTCAPKQISAACEAVT